ncbi:MAG: hypothetical protein M1826_005661, partial [Phylliscum demangeonii]
MSLSSRPSARARVPVDDAASVAATDPVRVALTTSSTESGKTVRAGPTSTRPPLSARRTSSFPFPSMLTPLLLGAEAGHRPFTALSPTGAPQSNVDEGRPGPWADPLRPSMEPGMPRQPPSRDPPDFPSPSLYDAVLLLNAEPGLDAWWRAVVQLCQAYLRAPRLSLAVPADATDAQNIPWGQKATFAFADDEDTDSLAYLERVLAEQRSESSIERERDRDRDREPEAGGESDEDEEEAVPDVGHPQRPALASRHSFAGFATPEATAADASAPRRAMRPVPARTRSAFAPTAAVPDPDRGPTRAGTPAAVSQPPSQGRPSTHPPSVAEFPTGNRAGGCQVMAVLRALDVEAEPLLDRSGVNQVLARGKVVVLCRDHEASAAASVHSKHHREPRVPATDDERSSSAASSTRPSRPKKHGATHERAVPDADAAVPSSAAPEPRLDSIPESQRSRSRPTALDQSRRSSQRSVRRAVVTAAYEDFEQLTSPWSKSPAPSPAIGSEPAENPFFRGATVDEDTFQQSSGPSEAYSSNRAIDAIGVDGARTVVHVPLMHPLLSRMRQTARGDARDAEALEPRWGAGTPVAILSVLSPIFPFPANLLESLTMLGPHLATSFSLAQHFSHTEAQAAAMLKRSWRQSASSAPTGTTHEDGSLEPATHLHLRRSSGDARAGPWSVAESMTSPSEFSSGGSLAFTPGGDVWGLDPSLMARGVVAGPVALGPVAAAIEGDVPSAMRPPLARGTSAAVPRVGTLPVARAGGPRRAASDVDGTRVADPGGRPSRPRPRPHPDDVATTVEPVATRRAVPPPLDPSRAAG